VAQFDNVTTDSAELAAVGDPADVYREVCAHIRATDEISLKLLAAVPLATGVGITLLVKAPSTNLPDSARALLGLFAAVVTFAIYRWERKNIATCSHFREWAAILERDYFKLSLPPGKDSKQGVLPHGKVSPVPSGSKLPGRSWGKTEAENLLYWTAILSWVSSSVYLLAI
jgi:hypothetical protein